MFPEDKLKCLTEAYRILKPGGVLINTHWQHLDMMIVNKAIMKACYESKNESPPTPPINPMALAEPGLFNNICIQGGFKKEKIETQESSYPFKFGSDPEFVYKAVTLPISPLIKELQCESIARKTYDSIINQYFKYDENTKSFVAYNNTFVMTTITK
jgi:hypothetical protein